MLKAPADQDLRGCPTIFRGDFLDLGVLQVPSPRERAVRLQLDVMPLAIFEEFSLIEERMELDLVHRWQDRGCTQEFLQMRNRVVAHPDRPGQSLLPDLHKRLPRFVPQLGHGPVNEIQVTYSKPSSRRLPSKARNADSNPWSLFQSFVVTKISSRGIPLSLTAAPTSRSFPYSFAVSIRR